MLLAVFKIPPGIVIPRAINLYRSANSAARSVQALLVVAAANVRDAHINHPINTPIPTRIAATIKSWIATAWIIMLLNPLISPPQNKIHR